MKALLSIILGTLISFSCLANPLTAPETPIIDEIYFDADGNWYIEFNTGYMSGSNFDNIALISSTDTAYCKSGIHFTDSIVVLTQDSLLHPFTLNKDGDCLQIEGYRNYNEKELFFPFGNHPYSQVYTIESNSSYQLSEVYAGHFSIMAIQKTPSIGKENSALPEGSITGIVLDKDSIPINDLKVQFKVYTYFYSVEVEDQIGYDVGIYNTQLVDVASDGTFTINNIPGCKYSLQFVEPKYLYDTTIVARVYPDSTINYNIKLDCSKTYTSLRSINEDNYALKVYPNPVSEYVQFEVTMYQPVKYTNAVLKLYSANSDLLEIIPVNSMETGSTIQKDLSQYPAGNYYCNLEVDSKKTLSKTIILSK